MGNMTLPEIMKIIEAIVPTAANSIGTGDYVCLKNVKRAWVVCQHYTAADNDVILGLYEATDVAAGTKAAVTATVPIWQNTDTSLSDALARGTDAATITIDTGALKNQIAVFEWDPALFTAGYDCLAVYCTDEGHASNIFSALYVLEMRYMSNLPPTVITD